MTPTRVKSDEGHVDVDRAQYKVQVPLDSDRYQQDVEMTGEILQ